MKNTLEEKKEVIKNLYLSGIGEEFIAMQLDLDIPIVIRVLTELGDTNLKTSVDTAPSDETADRLLPLKRDVYLFDYFNHMRCRSNTLVSISIIPFCTP